MEIWTHLYKYATLGEARHHRALLSHLVGNSTHVQMAESNRVKQKMARSTRVPSHHVATSTDIMETKTELKVDEIKNSYTVRRNVLLVAANNNK